MRILGIDPGSSLADMSTTGIAYGVYGDNTPYQRREVWAVQGGVDGFLDWWYATGEGLDLDIIVLEHFTPWSNSAVDSSPLLLEGAVIALLHTRPTQLVLQSASGKDTAVSNRVLRQLGLYEDKLGSHHHDVREATRHVLWFLKKTRHMPTLLSAWPPRG